VWKSGGNSGGFVQVQLANKSGSLSLMQFSMWERLNIHALHYLELQVLYDWIVSKHPQILTIH
jgi:hypothetical protein